MSQREGGMVMEEGTKDIPKSNWKQFILRITKKHLHRSNDLHTYSDNFKYLFNNLPHRPRPHPLTKPQ